MDSPPLPPCQFMGQSPRPFFFQVVFNLPFVAFCLVSSLSSHLSVFRCPRPLKVSFSNSHRPPSQMVPPSFTINLDLSPSLLVKNDEDPVRVFSSVHERYPPPLLIFLPFPFEPLLSLLEARTPLPCQGHPPNAPISQLSKIREP